MAGLFDAELYVITGISRIDNVRTAVSGVHDKDTCSRLLADWKTVAATSVTSRFYVCGWIGMSRRPGMKFNLPIKQYHYDDKECSNRQRH